MGTRNDISNFLIHFTKGETLEDAFNNIISILEKMALFGHDSMIKGKFKCVCFSEAPLDAIREGLVNEDLYSKYSPFGIMVSKEWLFKKGGRPVIYQTEEEYKLLGDNSWRHVTFDLNSEPAIDFTWEREWRIKTDKLEINESNSTIVAPNKFWAEKISDHFNWSSYYGEVDKYERHYGDKQMAMAMASSHGYAFEWPIITLIEDSTSQV